MTVLIAGISFVLLTSFTWFLGSLTDVTERRAEAQTAADASALAAVGAMVPGAEAEPEAEARRFASANGATLLSCVCGSSSAVVTVSVDGIEARAKAEIDTARLRPQGLGASAVGLHPQLRAAVDKLLAAGEGRITLISGWRSTERQTELWSGALQKYGSAEAADDWVAPPGHSKHELGLAVDLGGDLELAARLVTSLGLPLYAPMTHEPWHWELVGLAAG
jgi:hypothetical protein